jgi:4-hydroxy-tetrahydrodipicolinate synthase
MLTPFTNKGAIDEGALKALVDWYIKGGVDGLFASCQSSEIFNMDFEERMRIARITVEAAAGRVPVVASGFTDYALDDQVTSIKAMADTGVDAVILLTNRLALEDEGDDILLKRLFALLDSIPQDIHLGLYECPHPYKRLLSLPILKEAAATGRFYFLKDTCCDAQMISARVKAIAGSHLKLYNANTTTLLQSLRDGAPGYSGVMANFHPQPYVWLTRHINHPNADMVQSLLTCASQIERQYYPVNAKYHLQAVENLPMDIFCRTRDASGLTETFREEVRQMDRLVRAVATDLCV